MGERPMTAWLHTRTTNDLTGTTADHPPVRVCGDPQHLMDAFGNTHPEYTRRGDTWVRTRPHRMNPDGTPDHDRTQWSNTNGQLTTTHQDTRPWHPTSGEHHLVWYQDNKETP